MNEETKKIFLLLCRAIAVVAAGCVHELGYDTARQVVDIMVDTENMIGGSDK